MAKRKQHNTPKPMQVFEKTFRGKRYLMTVVPNGTTVGYRCGNVTYKTPSSAAQSITKHAVNGWLFWKIGYKS